MRLNRTLLIVDDDAEDRKLVIDAVRDFDRSIMCITANDGRQALEFLKNPLSVLPDLIFLDLLMPRVNGIKCLREIMEDERLKHIPVVIYAGTHEMEEAYQLKDQGAVHFISKPDNVDEVYFILAHVLEEHFYF